MKRVAWLLFCMAMAIVACNGNGKSNAITKDTTKNYQADTFHYNPALPAAQNSDDPDRFSQ